MATNDVATQLTLYSDTLNITTLPVKAINLQVNPTNGQVQLQWQTTDEINTASFNIQNSSDAASFIDIGIKDAVGSGNNEYSFIDKKLVSGINYYRLQTVDIDGRISYSKIVSVNMADKQLFSVFPNPSKDFANISFSQPIENAIIAVYDM